MIDPKILEAEPVPTRSKWIAGIGTDELVCEVASRVLDARLKAVCRTLPLAAEKSDEDVEHVHHLRISVRRAVAAVRIFSGLMDDTEAGDWRDRLRQIRLTADEARNWDVMAGRFTRGEGIPAGILQQIKARRREVQEPIVAVYRAAEADGFMAKVEQLVAEVASHRQGEGQRRFGRQAPRYLASVVAKFFAAAESDLSTDKALHALRIRTKKLRYTMEIVAVAFDMDFRKRLYPQVSLFQDLLGAVNDHATAKQLVQAWALKAEDATETAFLKGLLLAEQGAADDLRAAFLATWTPKVVSGLKKQFGKYA